MPGTVCRTGIEKNQVMFATLQVFPKEKKNKTKQMGNQVMTVRHIVGIP